MMYLLEAAVDAESYPASWVCCRSAAEHTAECIETRRVVDLVGRRLAAVLGAVILGALPLSSLTAELQSLARLVEGVCNHTGGGYGG